MGRIQVKKVRKHDSLVDQARFVFNISTFETIKANDFRFDKSIRLNRKQLKALERAGYVKSYKVFGERKFLDSTPPMHYVYEWTNKELGLIDEK